MADANDTINTLASELVEELTGAGLSVATAESCTGGWVAKSITDIPGSSGCFGYGVVTYSNAAKEALLGVRTETLESKGAVSEETVREMAQGVLQLSGADLAVAVSGIAGPDGGTEEKPVGTVWIGWSRRADGLTDSVRAKLHGDRDAIRLKSVGIALHGLTERARLDG